MVSKKPKRKHPYGFELSIKELAGRVGASYAHVYRIISTGKCKNPELAKRIEKETGGMVRAACLLGL